MHASLLVDLSPAPAVATTQGPRSMMMVGGHEEYMETLLFVLLFKENKGCIVHKRVSKRR